METGRLLDLSRWIAESGLSGLSEADLLQGFCERCLAEGLPLWRAFVGGDTLHPIVQGRIFEWRRNWGHAVEAAYDRSEGLESDERWLRSPPYYLTRTGARKLRRRLEDGYRSGEFPIVDDLRAEGATDYLAAITSFGPDRSIGAMDCAYSSWATDRPGGFRDSDLTALESLLPFLTLAMKSASVTRIAEAVIETYLGRDAGRRVLRGHIERGVAERIRAVLWLSDLRGFTRIADSVAAEQLVPLLNDYAEALVSAINGHGGQVLKFIGDGLLAIFDMEDPEEACSRALDAAEDGRRRVAALNERRGAEGLPTTGFYLGLNVGDVFYGNVGSIDRLDFTVVGPAVNEASRIAAMCRSLDQEIVLSSAFADAAGAGRKRLVSLGRYALRGVRRPQELFTIDPDGDPDDVVSIWRVRSATPSEP
jgi:adenylate cyclase